MRAFKIFLCLFCVYSSKLVQKRHVEFICVVSKEEILREFQNSFIISVTRVALRMTLNDKILSNLFPYLNPTSNLTYKDLKTIFHAIVMAQDRLSFYFLQYLDAVQDLRNTLYSDLLNMCVSVCKRIIGKNAVTLVDLHNEFYCNEHKCMKMCRFLFEVYLRILHQDMRLTMLFSFLEQNFEKSEIQKYFESFDKDEITVSVQFFERFDILEPKILAEELLKRIKQSNTDNEVVLYINPQWSINSYLYTELMKCNSIENYLIDVYSYILENPDDSQYDAVYLHPLGFIADYVDLGVSLKNPENDSARKLTGSKSEKKVFYESEQEYVYWNKETFFEDDNVSEGKTNQSINTPKQTSNSGLGKEYLKMKSKNVDKKDDGYTLPISKNPEGSGDENSFDLDLLRKLSACVTIDRYQVMDSLSIRDKANDVCNNASSRFGRSLKTACESKNAHQSLNNSGSTRKDSSKLQSSKSPKESRVLDDLLAQMQQNTVISGSREPYNRRIRYFDVASQNITHTNFTLHFKNEKRESSRQKSVYLQKMSEYPFFSEIATFLWNESTKFYWFIDFDAIADPITDHSCSDSLRNISTKLAYKLRKVYDDAFSSLICILKSKHQKFTPILAPVTMFRKEMMWQEYTLQGCTDYTKRLKDFKYADMVLKSHKILSDRFKSLQNYCEVAKTPKDTAESTFFYTHGMLHLSLRFIEQYHSCYDETLSSLQFILDDIYRSQAPLDVEKEMSSSACEKDNQEKNIGDLSMKEDRHPQKTTDTKDVDTKIETSGISRKNSVHKSDRDDFPSEWDEFSLDCHLEEDDKDDNLNVFKYERSKIVTLEANENDKRILPQHQNNYGHNNLLENQAVQNPRMQRIPKNFGSYENPFANSDNTEELNDSKNGLLDQIWSLNPLPKHKISPIKLIDTKTKKIIVAGENSEPEMHNPTPKFIDRESNISEHKIAEESGLKGQRNSETHFQHPDVGISALSNKFTSYKQLSSQQQKSSDSKKDISSTLTNEQKDLKLETPTDSLNHLVSEFNARHNAEMDLFHFLRCSPTFLESEMEQMSMNKVFFDKLARYRPMLNICRELVKTKKTSFFSHLELIGELERKISRTKCKEKIKIFREIKSLKEAFEKSQLNPSSFVNSITLLNCLEDIGISIPKILLSNLRSLQRYYKSKPRLIDELYLESKVPFYGQLELCENVFIGTKPTNKEFDADEAMKKHKFDSGAVAYCLENIKTELSNSQKKRRKQESKKDFRNNPDCKKESSFKNAPAKNSAHVCSSISENDTEEHSNTYSGKSAQLQKIQAKSSFQEREKCKQRTQNITGIENTDQGVNKRSKRNRKRFCASLDINKLESSDKDIDDSAKNFLKTDEAATRETTSSNFKYSHSIEDFKIPFAPSSQVKASECEGKSPTSYGNSLALGDLRSDDRLKSVDPTTDSVFKETSMAKLLNDSKNSVLTQNIRKKHQVLRNQKNLQESAADSSFDQSFLSNVPDLAEIERNHDAKNSNSRKKRICETSEKPAALNSDFNFFVNNDDFEEESNKRNNGNSQIQNLDHKIEDLFQENTISKTKECENLSEIQQNAQIKRSNDQKTLADSTREINFEESRNQPDAQDKDHTDLRNSHSRRSRKNMKKKLAKSGISANYSHISEKNQASTLDYLSHDSKNNHKTIIEPEKSLGSGDYAQSNNNRIEETLRRVLPSEHIFSGDTGASSIRRLSVIQKENLNTDLVVTTADVSPKKESSLILDNSTHDYVKNSVLITDTLSNSAECDSISDSKDTKVFKKYTGHYAHKVSKEGVFQIVNVQSKLEDNLSAYTEDNHTNENLRENNSIQKHPKNSLNNNSKNLIANNKTLSANDLKDSKDSLIEVPQTILDDNKGVSSHEIKNKVVESNLPNHANTASFTLSSNNDSKSSLELSCAPITCSQINVKTGLIVSKVVYSDSDKRAQSCDLQPPENVESDSESVLETALHEKGCSVSQTIENRLVDQEKYTGDPVHLVGLNSYGHHDLESLQENPIDLEVEKASHKNISVSGKNQLTSQECSHFDIKAKNFRRDSATGVKHSSYLYANRAYESIEESEFMPKDRVSRSLEAKDLSNPQLTTNNQLKATISCQIGNSIATDYHGVIRSTSNKHVKNASTNKTEEYHVNQIDSNDFSSSTNTFRDAKSPDKSNNASVQKSTSLCEDPASYNFKNSRIPQPRKFTSSTDQCQSHVHQSHEKQVFRTDISPSKRISWEPSYTRADTSYSIAYRDSTETDARSKYFRNEPDIQFIQIIRASTVFQGGIELKLIRKKLSSESQFAKCANRTFFDLITSQEAVINTLHYFIDAQNLDILNPPYYDCYLIEDDKETNKFHRCLKCKRCNKSECLVLLDSGYVLQPSMMRYGNLTSVVSVQSNDHMLYVPGTSGPEFDLYTHFRRC